jgi:hypothetical protein
MFVLLIFRERIIFWPQYNHDTSGVMPREVGGPLRIIEWPIIDFARIVRTFDYVLHGFNSILSSSYSKTVLIFTFTYLDRASGRDGGVWITRADESVGLCGRNLGLTE